MSMMSIKKFWTSYQGWDSIVETPYGEGTVIETNVLLEQVKVKIKKTEENSDEIQVCGIEEVTKVKEKRSLKEQLEINNELEEPLEEEELKQLKELEEE